MAQAFDPTTPIGDLPKVTFEEADHLIGYHEGRLVLVAPPKPQPKPEPEPVKKSVAKKSGAFKKDES